MVPENGLSWELAFKMKGQGAVTQNPTQCQTLGKVSVYMYTFVK